MRTRGLIYLVCILTLLFIVGCETDTQNITEENIENAYPTPGLKPVNEYSKEAEDYRAIGINKYNQGQYELALDNFHQALIRDNLIDNTEGVAQTHNSMGVTYMAMLDYRMAYEHFSTAFQIYSNMNDRAGLGETYMNLGKYYYRQKDYHNAIENYNRSIIYFNSLRAEANLANAYNSIGLCYLELQEYSKALWHFSEARVRNEHSREYRQLAANYNNMGLTFMQMNSNYLALRHFKVAHVIDKRLEDSRAIGTDLYNLGSVYRRIAYEIRSNYIAVNTNKELPDEYYTQMAHAQDYYNRSFNVRDSIFKITPTVQDRDIVIKTLNTLIEITAEVGNSEDLQRYQRILEAIKRQ